MFRIEAARQTGWRPGCLLKTHTEVVFVTSRQGGPDCALGPSPLEPRTPPRQLEPHAASKTGGEASDNESSGACSTFELP